ncbi:prepilin-type N-terminal cleavage/methylation domain-containing protein [Pseudomonas aeruginosa]|nr:prepilin-type N-terminal cleavage/methylation domain-containing protein [Pseudomonas aeruginosa]
MLFSKMQKGLSMVELLVALAISSFLILGISQIYIDNKRNYLFQQGQAGNQENSRFVLMLLQQQLDKTAYRRLHDDNMENAFKSATFNGCRAFVAGETIAAATALKAGEYGVCLRYQPAYKGEHDCLGNEITGVPEKPFTNTPPVVVRLVYLPSAGTLSCSRPDIAQSKSGELVSGLTDFRLEAGVGPAGRSERKVSSFVALQDVAGRPIRALRFSILAGSDNTSLRTGDDSQARDRWIVLYPESKSAIEAADKGQIYQIARGNQTIRNLMP